MVSAQGRWILLVAIVGLLAMMAGMFYYVGLDKPLLETAEIKLFDVEIIDVNSIENSIKLQIVFLVKNPSAKTFTVPVIAYELFANGKSLGSDAYSTADIAMPGRAAFYGGTEIPLKDFFNFVLSEEIADEYDAIASGEQIEYRVTGIITVENAWSIIEKDFESILQK